MTGRDLISYILKNGLEDEPIVKDGKLIGFITTEEAAVKASVGPATIAAWINEGQIDYVFVGKTIYIPANFTPPIGHLMTSKRSVHTASSNSSFSRDTALAVLKELSNDMRPSYDLYGNKTLVIDRDDFEIIRHKYLDF